MLQTFRIRRIDGKCLQYDGWGREMWVQEDDGWFCAESEEAVRTSGYFRSALDHGCILERPVPQEGA